MKNKNKQPKTKKTIEEIAEIQTIENSFAEIVIEKRKLLEIIRTSASFASKQSDVLKAIKIRAKDDSLTLWATDGNRAIETSIGACIQGNLKEVEIAVFSNLLMGLCFNVTNGDFINLKINKKSISFDDPANGTYYKLRACDFRYPDVEKVINNYEYKENRYEIAFNRSYMENMKRLHVDERTNIVKAVFNKENNLNPIIFQTQDDSCDIKQRALIMSIQIR